MLFDVLTFEFHPKCCTTFFFFKVLEVIFETLILEYLNVYGVPINQEKELKNRFSLKIPFSSNFKIYRKKAIESVWTRCQFLLLKASSHHIIDLPENQVMNDEYWQRPEVEKEILYRK